jgi:hypothetical protein
MSKLLSRTQVEKIPSRFSSKPEYVYLNIDIMNSSQSAHFGSGNPEIKYSDSLQYEIIENPSEYEFYFSRFSAECGVLLPIWSPEIQDGQPDINLSVYGCTMTVLTYSSTKYIEYVPEFNVNAPPRPDLSLDNEHYYYVYTYSHVVTLFNNMIQACYADLQTQYGSDFKSKCPFLAYDASSGLFSIYVDQTDELFGLQFNSNLYSMFYSFYFQNTNQLVINNNGLNSVTIGTTVYTKVTQDFPSTSMWSPISTLVFTTTKIPIVPEQSTAPLLLNDDSNLGDNFTNAQTRQKIITDIALPIDKSSDWRGFITYTPTFPRIMNLDSISPLKDIDINLFFKDKSSGKLIPVCIGNGGNVNMKLCFKRKAIY